MTISGWQICPAPQDAALTCAQVESRPKNKKSGYSKRVSYIDYEEYRAHKIEYYNRRGDLEKFWNFQVISNIWAHIGEPLSWK